MNLGCKRNSQWSHHESASVWKACDYCRFAASSCSLRGVQNECGQCSRHGMTHAGTARTPIEQAIQLALDFAQGTRKPHEICGECDHIPRAADKAALAASEMNAFEASNAAEAAACAASSTVSAADSAQCMTRHDSAILLDAAAQLAYGAGQRMLLALTGEAKAEALTAVEELFAELLGDRNAEA